jgi:uncharacterized SAM-binding protein YcdF (DUF218 family)
MQDYDVVIILGGGADGTLNPTFYTKERLKFFLKKKRLLKLPIIVSGGYSIADLRAPKHTEAEVMKHYLVEQGIPSKNIYQEKNSRDTIGNAYNSKQTVKRHPRWRNIIVVTSKAHISRARWIFERIFGKTYSLSFLGANAKVGTIGKNPTGRKKYDNYIIRLYEEIFRSAKWGDDKSIMRILKKIHPIYSNGKKVKEFEKKSFNSKEKFLGIH